MAQFRSTKTIEHSVGAPKPGVFHVQVYHKCVGILIVPVNIRFAVLYCCVAVTVSLYYDDLVCVFCIDYNKFLQSGLGVFHQN